MQKKETNTNLERTQNEQKKKDKKELVIKSGFCSRMRAIQICLCIKTPPTHARIQIHLRPLQARCCYLNPTHPYFAFLPHHPPWSIIIPTSPFPLACSSTTLLSHLILSLPLPPFLSIFVNSCSFHFRFHPFFYSILFFFFKSCCTTAAPSPPFRVHLLSFFSVLRHSLPIYHHDDILYSQTWTSIRIR